MEWVRDLIIYCFDHKKTIIITLIIIRWIWLEIHMLPKVDK